MKNYQYALFSQGDDIPQLLEKIFKVASILCFMSIQIPIPKVSFYTPLALPTTKILSYLYFTFTQHVVSISFKGLSFFKKE